MIRYIDLFAGIGGIRLGVVQAFDEYRIISKCVLSSEIDNYACETYKLNFNEIPKGDIRNIKNIDNFELLLAGFPCQPFSYAGKQKGFGDTRGTLFFEIESIIKIYRPRAIILENVRGLVSHDNGRTFNTILNSIKNLGYGVKYLILNSSNFNVPQNRIRLYIIGIYNKEPKISLSSNIGATDSHKFKLFNNNQLSLFYNDNHKKKLIKHIIQDEVDEKYYCSKLFERQLKNIVGDDLSQLHGYRLIDFRGGNSLHSWELGTKGECNKDEIEFMNLLIKNRRKHIFGIHQDGKKLSIDQIKSFYKSSNINDIICSLINKGYLQETDNKYNPVCGNMSFEIFKFLDPNSISITLTSSDSNRLGIIRNNRPCHITPRECARIQGFPDDFIIHEDDFYAYKQLGNSVSVPVIKKIMCDLLENNNIF